MADQKSQRNYAARRQSVLRVDLTLGVLWEQRSSGPPNERECVCEMKDGFKQTVRGVMGKGFGSGAVVQ